MTNQDPQSIKDKVLSTINAGSVKMRPRWQFVLQSIAMLVGLILIFLLMLFVVSFGIFLLQRSGVWFALQFGSHGLKELLATLPVLFLVLTVIFLLLLQVLAHRYSFSYSRPMLYTLLGTIILVVGGSFVIAKTQVHEDLYRLARNDHLPFVAGLYTKYPYPKSDRVVPGLIRDLQDKGFTLIDPVGKSWVVVIDEQTKLPYNDDLDVNDSVVVMGDKKEENVIEAEGIMKIRGHDGIYEFREERGEDFDHDGR